MSTTNSAVITWRKSSRSNGQTECVEVAGTLGAVRDSKSPAGPPLCVDLAPMVAVIKAGRLDR
jgi:hypothetical protein